MTLRISTMLVARAIEAEVIRVSYQIKYPLTQASYWSRPREANEVACKS